MLQHSKTAQSRQAQAVAGVARRTSPKSRFSIDTVALDRVREVVIAVNSAEEILYVNPAAEALYDIRMADVLGRRFSDVITGLHLKQQELAHFGRVAAMGELAVVIAHELDQPLTAVVSNAQAVRSMLQEEKPDLAEVDEALQDVIDAAMRVAEITQRERKLLRKSELSIAPVDVNEMIREVELFIRAEARQDGGTLTLELTPGLPMIMADGVQLQQVILNLARNAFQAMLDQPRETRKVCIRTMAQSGEVILTVADSGPPIDEACLKQMFQPFYTTKSNGLGMGLSISKSIIETHRGRISAIRNPDRGLTMQIALPRIEANHVNPPRRNGAGR